MSVVNPNYGNILFIADGKPATPLVATPEKIEQIAQFLKTFPLATTWKMTDEQIFQFIMAPDVIGIEVDTALVMFENVRPGFKAHIGFVFWDRKVSGREALLRDVFVNVSRMLQLNKLYCRIPHKNRIMWRMLEKVGFKLEGRLREDFPLSERRFDDTLIYGWLRREMEKQLTPATGGENVTGA